MPAIEIERDANAMQLEPAGLADNEVSCEVTWRNKDLMVTPLHKRRVDAL